MSRHSGASFFYRGVAAALAALLVSASVLAAPRPVGTPSCCRLVEAPMGCCGPGHVPADSSADCCRLSAPEEAAPSLLSPVAPALAAPLATALDMPLASPVASLAGAARRVATRARSGPLFLLFAVFLV